MSAGPYIVILTRSTSSALKAEKALVNAGIECKLIPVPRHLSSDCGVCIRIRREDQDAALRALELAQVDVAGVHAL